MMYSMYNTYKDTSHLCFESPESSCNVIQDAAPQGSARSCMVDRPLSLLRKANNPTSSRPVLSHLTTLPSPCGTAQPDRAAFSSPLPHMKLRRAANLGNPTRGPVRSRLDAARSHTRNHREAVQETVPFPVVASKPGTFRRSASVSPCPWIPSLAPERSHSRPRMLQRWNAPFDSHFYSVHQALGTLSHTHYFFPDRPTHHTHPHEAFGHKSLANTT